MVDPSARNGPPVLVKALELDHLSGFFIKCELQIFNRMR